MDEESHPAATKFLFVTPEKFPLPISNFHVITRYKLIIIIPFIGFNLLIVNFLF